MSVLKDLAGKQFWIGQALTILVILAVAGLGALLAVSGALAVDRVWMWVCVVWAAAGLFSGRYAGPNSVLRSVVSILITMAFMWVIGLTTPEDGSGEMLRWPWYIGSGLVGAVVAVALPRKNKRHKRTKGRGKQARK